MREIDIDAWDRREHFSFFMKSDLPFYNVNFPLDVSGIREFSVENGLSLHHVLIYGTIKAMVGIKNFRYRCEKGKVVEYDSLDPSFACLRDGEELFRLITVAYNEDIRVFDRMAKEAIAASAAHFDLAPLRARSNFVFISALPWIPFSGIDHTASLNKEDAIPRVSWGRIHEADGRMVLPYNIQVNHAFIDGLHVGRFYESLDREIRRLSGRN